MRLLITTQAVDLDDPVLGFFHRWIEEFARQCEEVSVICLKEGRHELPGNVSVYSLGKESGRSLPKYLWRFYRAIWMLRYDAVFVHMNPEYAVLGGLLWRLMRRPSSLWYIHPRSSLRLRLATLLVNHVLSAAKDSFPFETRKLIALGHGIDADFFKPGHREPSATFRVMHGGRLAPVKHIDLILDAIAALRKRAIAVTFDQYGEELPRDAAYASGLRSRAAAVGGVEFHGRASPGALRDAYRSHDVHVNATDSGSFDKAVLESMACGTITLASNVAFEGVLPGALRFIEGDAVSLADRLEGIARMPAPHRAALEGELRTIAKERFGLSVLVRNILAHL